MGLSLHETGRLTLTTFNKLYKHYKDNFDFELWLQREGLDYRKALEKANSEEEWL